MPNPWQVLWWITCYRRTNSLLRSSIKAGRLSGSSDPFIDVLFNFLMGILFLFLVTLYFVKPDHDQARVDKSAEFIVSATWPHSLKDDIDLWVKGPDDSIVSYLKKDVGWLHLERDDRGEVNDKIVIDGVEQVHSVNQEVVTFRKVWPGEYVVNLYYYHQESSGPIEVTVKIDKINPKFETVFAKKVILAAVDEEVTVTRFEVSASGETTQFSELPIVLTPYALDPDSQWVN